MTKMEKSVSLFLILGLFSVVLIAGCASNIGGNISTTGFGRAVFGVKDAAANMGSVSSIQMTVSNVQVHSATEGWMTVSSNAKTYDLMQLRADGSTALLADANLKAGTYDQMRMEVSNVVVTNASGSYQAKLPSNEFKVIGNLVVQANSTSSATFDFIADESLHVTGKGEFIMAPVAQVQTRESTNVQTQSNGRIEISNGKVDTDIKVGMDINGNVGVGLSIPASAALSIGADGKVGLGYVVSAQGRGVFAIGDPAANMSSVTSVQVTVQNVSVHSDAEGWVMVATAPKTYDLMQLDASGKNALMADINLSEGTYNQLRLDISKVVIVDANGSQEAKLPSGMLKITGDLIVKANATATAWFDFAANESLHVTGNSSGNASGNPKYIFAPVLRMETREAANATVMNDNDVRISGGTVKTNVKVGMDASGNVGVGMGIPANANLTISGSGSIGMGAY